MHKFKLFDFLTVNPCEVACMYGIHIRHEYTHIMYIIFLADNDCYFKTFFPL